MNLTTSETVQGQPVDFEACIDELYRLKAQRDQLWDEHSHIRDKAYALALRESVEETIPRVARLRRLLDRFERLDQFGRCGTALILARHWLDEAIRSESGKPVAPAAPPLPAQQPVAAPEPAPEPSQMAPGCAPHVQAGPPVPTPAGQDARTDAAPQDQAVMPMPPMQVFQIDLLRWDKPRAGAELSSQTPKKES